MKYLFRNSMLQTCQSIYQNTILSNHRNARNIIFDHVLFYDIYTFSVFCYDKHKKNSDIHFSNKRQAWRMSRLLRRLFWIPPCCVFKNGYFIVKMGQNGWFKLFPVRNTLSGRWLFFQICYSDTELSFTCYINRHVRNQLQKEYFTFSFCAL